MMRTVLTCLALLVCEAGTAANASQTGAAASAVQPSPGFSPVIPKGLKLAYPYVLPATALQQRIGRSGTYYGRVTAAAMPGVFKEYTQVSNQVFMDDPRAVRAQTLVRGGTMFLDRSGRVVDLAWRRGQLRMELMLDAPTPPRNLLLEAQHLHLIQ